MNLKKEYSTMFSVLLIVFLSVFMVTSITSAGTLFGPKEYQRTTGPPDVYEETITIDYEILVPCTLRVLNGDSLGNNRVSVASIYWNGVKVVRENEWNQQVYEIKKKIDFDSTNVLKIRLRSVPEGYITISILGPHLKEIWKKEYPDSTINDVIGYDFVSGAREVFMWLYREDINGMEYLDSLGNVVKTIRFGDYSVPYRDPGYRRPYWFSGISENGQYFAKSGEFYQTIVNPIYGDTSYFPSHAEIEVMDYKGNLIYHLDNLYEYAVRSFISNDGKIVFAYSVELFKTPKYEVFHNGVNVLKDGEGHILFRDGAFSPDGRRYIFPYPDTVIAFNSFGNIAWKLPIVNRWYGNGWKNKTGFASTTGDRFLIATRSGKRGISHATYLLNRNGDVIRIYDDIAIWMADFDESGQYAVMNTMNTTYCIETSAGEILWEKGVDHSNPNPCFRYVSISPLARFVVAAELKNFPTTITLDPFIAEWTLWIYDRKGEPLIRKGFVDLEYKAMGDEWAFCRLSREGRHLAVRVSKDRLVIYNLDI